MEADLSYMQEYSQQSNETLFKEFEEKILACNGEIERVIGQCNEAMVSGSCTTSSCSENRISNCSITYNYTQSDRDDFETQLRQMEVQCATYVEELASAKLRLRLSDEAHHKEVSNVVV